MGAMLRPRAELPMDYRLSVFSPISLQQRYV
jgi:hypothetical protein